MSARPTVSVYPIDGGAAKRTLPLPGVFSAPIRHDIVKYVVAQCAKNKRQAYGVSRRAGHKHSAESWGTGRAVSRIPRVSGGGTHASGAGAFGNMCRGGHMFAPTKTFRKWHVAVPRKIRRNAVASAIAATASAPLVAARGHRIDGIAEIPLVVSDAIEKITKTKQAEQVLVKLGAGKDLQKARESVKMRAGVGKWRNRRYITRRGPLVVCGDGETARKAFRNIPGVEAVPVSSLNVAQLAPGGHLGRLVVWTESAFAALDKMYGESCNVAAPGKAKFRIPRCVMTNADVTSIINSNEIQSKLRPRREQRQVKSTTVNPLRNRNRMYALSPFLASAQVSKKLKQSRAVRVLTFLVLLSCVFE